MQKLIGNQLRKPKGFFGKIISKLMQKGNSSIYNKIILELEIKKGNKILEIGFGPSIGAERILSKYDCFVSGIDFSELMFTEATKRNKKFIESKKAEFYCGDFLSTPNELPRGRAHEVSKKSQLPLMYLFIFFLISL